MWIVFLLVFFNKVGENIKLHAEVVRILGFEKPSYSPSVLTDLLVIAQSVLNIIVLDFLLTILDPL